MAGTSGQQRLTKTFPVFDRSVTRGESRKAPERRAWFVLVLYVFPM